jgi:luciferase family oxidoreductase group 1
MPDSPDHDRARDHELRLSVLDVCPVPAGSTAGEAIGDAVQLARAAEELGLARYWVAEHHNTSSIASSVPAVIIAHLAAATSTLRVGSGGVMLPNHAPLHVAESFRLLEALHPGRIDLGIGRAPGTDGRTALALRRSAEALRAENFPEELDDLLGFLTDGLAPDHPFASVTASPKGGDAPEIFLLGSSGYSAQLAAALGLGFAFAHHINPTHAAAVLRHYRAAFQPSRFAAEPYAILGLSALAADSEDEAERLAATLDLAWLHIGQGRNGPTPTFAEALAYEYSPAEEAQRLANRERHAVGSGRHVAAPLRVMAEEAAADEVMVLTMAHDLDSRRHSYELLAAELLGTSRSPATTGAGR